jgi:hypothetical protein
MPPCFAQMTVPTQERAPSWSDRRFVGHSLADALRVKQERDVVPCRHPLEQLSSIRCAAHRRRGTNRGDDLGTSSTLERPQSARTCLGVLCRAF